MEEEGRKEPSWREPDPPRGIAWVGCGGEKDRGRYSVIGGGGESGRSCANFRSHSRLASLSFCSHVALDPAPGAAGCTRAGGCVRGARFCSQTRFTDPHSPTSAPVKPCRQGWLMHAGRLPPRRPVLFNFIFSPARVASVSRTNPSPSVSPSRASARRASRRGCPPAHLA